MVIIFTAARKYDICLRVLPYASTRVGFMYVFDALHAYAEDTCKKSCLWLFLTCPLIENSKGWLDAVAEICVCLGVVWYPVGMCWLYLK